MRLSLMGMSGSGKTYWSIKLAACGFRRFCCDDMIAEKLATDLTRPDGNILELGEWMKFPYEPEHKERASKYLSYEVETLNELNTEPLPPELNLLISRVYCACTNEIIEHEWFKDLPPLKEILKDIQDSI